MKKKPLILIPGLLCDGALWEDQVAALAPVASCTITDKHLQYETIGQIAEAIVSQAPPRFSLAGLSMGGYIALEIGLKFSERVDRLALIDTSARADTTEQTERREHLIALCREGRFADVVDLLSAVLVHPDRLNDMGLKNRITDMAHRVGPEIFVRQQRAIMSRPDQVAGLATIACPTIVVCGEQDRITPLDCAQEMAANIHASELVVIPECGHMSTMEKPSTLSRTMTTWLTDDGQMVK